MTFTSYPDQSLCFVEDFKGLLQPSRHFTERVSQRGLPQAVQDYILTWAKPIYRSGQIFLTLRRKDLPDEDLSAPIARRVMGWILVLSHDGVLETCYWRKDAVTYLKRKPQLALSRSQLDRRFELRDRQRESARSKKKAARKSASSTINSKKLYSA